MYQTVTLPMPLFILCLLAAVAVGAVAWTWLADWLYRRSVQRLREADGTASRWPADDIGRPARRLDDRQGGAL